MGQWIQEGERTIFETTISIDTPNKNDYSSRPSRSGWFKLFRRKRVDEVNKMAELGTRIAHVDGGVPNIVVSIPN